jgi:hypothetical protein
MATGYENIYLSLLPSLASCNLAENAPRVGAVATEDGIRISFLGREYLITNAGVEPTDGLPVYVNNRSVLIYYIIGKGTGEPSYDFVQLNRLTGMIAGQTRTSPDMMNSPLIREFGGDHKKFGAAMAKLGGVESPAGSGKHVWWLFALPKILAQIVFYEPDDEFPVDIQIMFDKVTPRYLDFECLAVLSGCMAKALIENAD